jgi:hypothetical protein
MNISLIDMLLIKIMQEAAGACGGTDIVAKDACLEMGFSGKDIERAVAVYKEEQGIAQIYKLNTKCP